MLIVERLRGVFAPVFGRPHGFGHLIGQGLDTSPTAPIDPSDDEEMENELFFSELDPSVIKELEDI